MSHSDLCTYEAKTLVDDTMGLLGVAVVDTGGQTFQCESTSETANWSLHRWWSVMVFAGAKAAIGVIVGIV